MLRFLVTRLVGLVITLLVSGFLIFSSLYLTPGDPISTLSGGRSLPPEAVQAVRQQHHLDDPFATRYLAWLGDAARGDLGESFVFNATVADLISARVETTVLLVAMASVLILGVGITLGVLGGIRGGLLDKGLLVTTAIGQAVPSFVAAIVLIWLFAVQLSWFPAIGAGAGLVDRLHHLTLPAMALTLAYLAYVARIVRAVTRDELGREHVETARARGLSSSQVVRRHVVRNAMIPIATVSGLTIAGLLATTVVVERAFNLDGLGSLLVEAVVRKDVTVVQALSLILVTAFVVINTLVDLLSRVLDPRADLAVGT
jgi:peptide/nickel transport system permease protein